MTTRSAALRATARLLSRLPPSTTITSLPRARSSCREARASARTGAASRTGMMMLMGRDADICGELYARRYNAAMNQVQVPLPPLGNHFTDSLPGDPDTTNRPRQVQGACYSFV